MGRESKFSPEVRERAVRLVVEQQATHGSEWAAMTSIRDTTSSRDHHDRPDAICSIRATRENARLFQARRASRACRARRLACIDRIRFAICRRASASVERIERHARINSACGLHEVEPSVATVTLPPLSLRFRVSGGGVFGLAAFTCCVGW